jgi:hypothetical protein
MASARMSRVYRVCCMCLLSIGMRLEERLA